MAAATKPPWRAVGIVPGEDACEAALALRGRRFLLANIKRLPLPECTKQDRCDCKFQHYTDRRGSPRRDSDLGAPNAAKALSQERRRPGERRARRK